MEEPNFWDNPEEAQEQMKQLSSMKEDRDTYQKLVSAKEDMETLIEMGQEEDDDSVVPEIAEMMEEFKASFDAIRIKTHLLYLVYQLSFDVGLKIVYLYIRILFTESGKVVFKSNTAINGRFAFTQQIYIGAVNNLYSHNTFFYTFVHREHSFKVQRYEKVMKVEEKLTNKEKRATIIRKYQQYLRLEKSLSPNTFDAYMTDLQKLLHFLEGENIEIPDVTPDDLQRFAAGLHDIGIHPRSQARILSGIKSFFHFLVIADYQEADPSELLEGPKIGFRLPEVLTVEEIDRIIPP